LVFAISRWNTLDTLALEPSVAVTLMLSVPTSPLAGVPDKVRVLASKESHDGSALPSASVALSVSASPTSMSAKAFAGRTYENAASSVAT